MEPEMIADYACHVGEGPLWHPTEKRLYWVDIPQGRIFTYDPATEEHGLFYEGEVLGGFTFQADGSLLLFMAKGAVAVLREGELSYIRDEIPGEEENRFNDVVADPAGRVFCGTMHSDSDRANERGGTLFRLDTDGSITPVLRGLGISNGMGFTRDRKQMYFTDSIDLKIYIFDYDQETGSITNQRVFVETPEGDGLPDGMTVDAEGYVWSARAYGSALYRYTPKGEEERRIPFPAPFVSSVIFGGNDYKDIYVTTGGGEKKSEAGPEAGALFRINAGVSGVPDFYSRVGL